MWDRAKDLRRLIAFHKRKGHPLFMPSDGYCNFCCRDIVWPLIWNADGSKRENFPVLVTGCPRCSMTYCD